MSRILSFVLIFTLFCGVISTSVAVTPKASAQSAPSQAVIPVSITYTYSYENRGCIQYYPCETVTISTSFSGSANITPVEGGYEGTGSGSYEDIHDRVVDPYPGCSGDGGHTTTFGNADMVVHYQFSIDNDVTGGIDDSMYNSSWGIVEVLVEDYDLHTDLTSTICGETQSHSHDEGAVGFGCFFHSLDFTTGGTWTQIIPVTDDSTAKCVLSIGQSGDKMRIFGTVKGLFDGGVEGLPNSRVLLAKMEKEYYEKLSTSKPSFIMRTATSDNNTAEYEFNFTRGPGGLPKMMVVSLLWYEGGPEYATTNGKEQDGRLIPVYQALCVDDNDPTKCAKWKRNSDGSYQAEVKFEYGSEQKLVETLEFLESEHWLGLNITAPGGIAGNALLLTATTNMMSDSAYLYYNSYREMKYFETLGLLSPLNPLVIRSHDFDAGCEKGAWYNGKAIDPAYSRSFGGLGTFADRVEATGGEIVMCDAGGNSSPSVYDAPRLPLWHEIGHYLLFQMYDPITPQRGTPHQGYSNPSSNDAFIEGFAGFVAVLVDEHYGARAPQYFGQNLELEHKIWGVWGTDEEIAVASVLWDFHDRGREINLGHTINGTSVPISKVYQASMDDVSLDASTIMVAIDRNQVKTMVDLYNAFVTNRISAVDLDMIYANHGVFADVVERNYVHDSVSEKIGESGSKSSPVRLVRTTPPPELPGSYLVSDTDSTYNVTIDFVSPYDYYDYSYLQKMKAGEIMYFTMPPEYYPSTAFITPISSDGTPLSGGIDVGSDEYWTYISSSPPEDGVFRSISVTGDSVSDTITAVQYIQNVKDLLTKVSAEYRVGNATGAEELATMAYIDNFEHVEAELEQRNATDLKEQTEEMLRVELVGLIRDRAAPQSIDDKISEVNMMLDQAIVIVPEFPYGMVMVLMFGLIFTVFLARSRGMTWLRLW